MISYDSSIRNSLLQHTRSIIFHRIPASYFRFQAIWILGFIKKDGETMEKEVLIEKLRNQAYWCNQLADKLERGESIEDYLWTVDMPELREVTTIERKEREVA